MEKRDAGLISLAKSALSLFEKVASGAKEALLRDRIVTFENLVRINTFNEPEVLSNRVRSHRDSDRSFEILAREPAIARVVVEDDDGNRRTLFFCRAETGNAAAGLISYLAPLGRLASLPVGAEQVVSSPGGVASYSILERAELHPNAAGGRWDSINSIIYLGKRTAPITVRSLLALLRSDEAEAEQLSVLEQLLAEESGGLNVIEGIRRNVLRNISLRDQPILDQFQDEIFRLPLRSKLMLLGPPGSGKTTTLIRRLQQKLTFLDENVAEGERPPSSWIMLSPTELLKQYLKEAFARENVAASDEHVRTWSDLRRELARNKLGLLRDSAGKGSYVLRERAVHIRPDTVVRQIDWFADFYEWQARTFWVDMQSAARLLREHARPDVSTLGGQLERIVVNATTKTASSVFHGLSAFATGVQALFAKEREDTDRRLRLTLNFHVNRERGFLDDLSAFIGTLADPVESVEETESDDDEEERQPKVGRTAAMNAYMLAVRSHSRAELARRSLGRESRGARIIEWLGGRVPPREERLHIGESSQLQSTARLFLSPVRRYVQGVAPRYRQFRRTRQNEGRWYLADQIVPSDISPLELDVVLLAALHSAHELISDRRLQQGIDLPPFATLNLIRDEYRSQVLVDEATDFSPIQLACMYSLTTPQAESFFACGDYNQRITEWGTRSEAELSWACPSIVTKSIAVAYRQSIQLFQLSNAMIRICGGVETQSELPPNRDNNGLVPVLAKNLREVENIGRWLAARIAEIGQFIEPLPSIAVLVSREDDVVPIARALNEELSSQNMRAIPCTNGRFVGQESDVRVFDVQHIKGLEFEAVFFVGVDQLATIHPTLFDKYLYVGATRAATYLGWTCYGADLPPAIRALESSFGKQWGES